VRRVVPIACFALLAACDGGGGGDAGRPDVGLPNVNAPPLAEVADVEGEVGRPVTLSAAGSTDPDGDALLYAWEVVSVPVDSAGVTLEPPNAETVTFVPDTVGVFRIQVIVSDGRDVSQPAVATVLVGDRSDRPVADGGPDRIVAPGRRLVLDGSNSSDAMGRPLSYAWRLLSGEATLRDADTARLEVVPTVVGQVQVELVVTADGVRSRPDVVRIVVEEEPARIVDLRSGTLDPSGVYVFGPLARFVPEERRCGLADLTRPDLAVVELPCDVRDVAIAPDGAVLYLDGAGALRRFVCDAGCPDFLAAWDDLEEAPFDDDVAVPGHGSCAGGFTAIAQQPDGTRWLRCGDAWQREDGATVAATGAILALDAGGYALEDGGVRSPEGDVFSLPSLPSGECAWVAGRGRAEGFLALASCGGTERTLYEIARDGSGSLVALATEPPVFPRTPAVLALAADGTAVQLGRGAILVQPPSDLGRDSEAAFTGGAVSLEAEVLLQGP
jgi:hypothetical protein